MQLTASKWSAARERNGAVLSALDPPLLAITLVLLSLATLVMASATADFMHRFDAHLVNLAVALCVMLVVAQIPPLRLMQLALPFYAVGVVLLIGVELFGETSKGAQRWLNIGFTRIQPSEMLKISVPLMLAWYSTGTRPSSGCATFWWRRSSCSFRSPSSFTSRIWAPPSWCWLPACSSSSSPACRGSSSFRCWRSASSPSARWRRKATPCAPKAWSGPASRPISGSGEGAVREVEVDLREQR